ncbi:MAG: hypothetical protein HBSAPP04_00840 [Ignavibacteriaceae bacterium]|nr:MAG: hypothetical protein HBSAPP04_00840 [Ignavibacteriaceae bacterium]
MATTSFEKTKRRNIQFVIMFTAVGLIAHLLPLIDLNIIKVMIYDAEWALITIPLLALALGSVFIPDLRIAKIICFIASLVVLIIAVDKIIGFSSKMAEMGQLLPDNPFAEAVQSAVKLSFGIYLLAASAGFTMVSTFAMREELPEEDQEDEEDEVEETTSQLFP